MDTFAKTRSRSNKFGVVRTFTAHRRRIGVTDVRAVLEKIASESPHTRDRRIDDGLTARYIDQDRPNCLMAIVLTRLGFRTTILRALDEEYPVGEPFHPGARVGESGHPALHVLDRSARALLHHIQLAQDKGEAWGRIIKDAFVRNPWRLPRHNREQKPWLYPDPRP